MQVRPNQSYRGVSCALAKRYSKGFATVGMPSVLSSSLWARLPLGEDRAPAQHNQRPAWRLGQVFRFPPQSVDPMCLLAFQYRCVDNAPILVAHNREELFDRPTQVPRIQSGKPRSVCGIDRKAGGTWLGVNQHGLFATVTNRSDVIGPPKARSRGVLCRELLTFVDAASAVEHAATELATGRYAGANYVCADPDYAAVVYGGERVEVVELQPGLHLLTNGQINNPNDSRQAFVRRLLTLQKLDSAVAFLAVASRTFSRKPDSAGRRGVIIAEEDYGTVSSTLVSLSLKTQNAVFQYAPGPPSSKSYDDLSALLRQVLSTDK